MLPLNKRILIVFPDEWLAYAPMVLNLITVLSPDFEVWTLAVENGYFRNDLAPHERLRFVRIPKLLARTLNKLGAYKAFKAWCLVQAVSRLKKRLDFQAVIGVDSIGAWVGARLFGQVHLLSLEAEKDRFFRALKPAQLRSVTIQSQERLEYLFPERVPEQVFLVQNAPILPSGFTPEAKPFHPRLIFLGHALPSHGVFLCLDALRNPSASAWELTIKGIIPPWVKTIIEARYADLLQSGQVILDERYVPQAELLAYLEDFSIGFCFYDFNLLARDDFNYLSSPSGKLFNYYAAGIPVIGSDILGLASVHAFEAGVLLSDPTPQAIVEALEYVRLHYAELSRHCRQAACHHDFARAAQSLRRFLIHV